MTTIANMIEKMEPGNRLLIERTLAEMKVDITGSYDVFMKELSDKIRELPLPSKIAMLQLMSQGPNKFEPKLSHEQRCQVLALHRIGITREQLAKMYGINRRTVTSIYNPNSGHYAKVREEERILGGAAFQEKYLTDEIVESAMVDTQLKNAEKKVNNRNANGKSGLHVVRGQNTTYEHRVVISWRDAGEESVYVSGWYYRDLDGSFPDAWCCTDEESMRSSQACYAGMLFDITDKLEG